MFASHPLDGPMTLPPSILNDIVATEVNERMLMRMPELALDLNMNAIVLVGRQAGWSDRGGLIVHVRFLLVMHWYTILSCNCTVLMRPDKLGTFANCELQLGRRTD